MESQISVDFQWIFSVCAFFLWITMCDTRHCRGSHTRQVTVMHHSTQKCATVTVRQELLISTPLSSPLFPTVALTATSNCLTQLRNNCPPSPEKGVGSTLTSPPGKRPIYIPVSGLKGSPSPCQMSITQLCSSSEACETTSVQLYCGAKMTMARLKETHLLLCFLLEKRQDTQRQQTKRDCNKKQAFMIS